MLLFGYLALLQLLLEVVDLNLVGVAHVHLLEHLFVLVLQESLYLLV